LDLPVSHLQMMMSNCRGHVIKCHVCLLNNDETNNLQANVRSERGGN
jgi:hypothetical protein